MIDPRQVAAGIVGAVEWETEVSGLCHCPGESLHTQRTGKKDCRVNVDGAPTIYCFHASCAAVVAEANKRLRRELGQSEWSLVLPGGVVLRSGDVLKTGGSPTGAAGSAGSAAPTGGPVCQPDGKTYILRRETIREQALANGQGAAAALELETLKACAERFKVDLFSTFRWTVAEILADSPLLVADREADEQFRTWLKLWPAHCHVWVGEVYSSGKPEHKTHFRPVADWYQIGPVMGNFTCGSAFVPGSFQRSNANCDGNRFLVVESDTLAKDEVGAVFAYLNHRLRFNLHAIIDTAGKSLHGWFDAPRDRAVERELKAVLTVFGCDPKMFTYSQPVRVPGALRDGRLQRIIWLKN